MKITNIIYIETPAPQSKPYVQVTVQFTSNQVREQNDRKTQESILDAISALRSDI
jgi:hypothetical protein